MAVTGGDPHVINSSLFDELEPKGICVFPFIQKKLSRQGNY